MAKKAFDNGNVLQGEVSVGNGSGKVMGAGYNKGQNGGGSNVTTGDAGMGAKSTGAGHNKGQNNGGTNNPLSGAIPGFSGGSIINGKI